MVTFIEHFGDIADPRMERTKAHKLIDVLFITYIAILCGCDDCYAIERFGYAKEAWLRKYLKLSNGLPSHDTLNRVILAIHLLTNIYYFHTIDSGLL